ncbi:transient receptor potential cation channel subfamily M member 5-like [Amphiura filiformis]|uniref:transient receptor potential cation channel subfamily M member 5-like n=1 Tax=Amphiura filiformis TaxID=82378 RepID=UPI003B21ED97
MAMLHSYSIPKGIKEWMFLTTPRSRFWTNAAMYVLFLGYFSYVMVSDKLPETSYSGYDAFLMVWVGTFILEEIRELVKPCCAVNDVFASVSRGRRAQVKQYFTSAWNYMNFVQLLLFVLGEIMRWFPEGRSAGRILLAFSLFVFYIRFLQNLTIVGSNIGAKVIMIFKTLFDFFAMVAILLVVLIGYGVAAQALLFPHVTDPKSVAAGIFFRPVFQIYGELFLDEINATPSDGTCSTNETVILLGDLPPCPQHREWGIVFLVIYMVLSNILLLNIFIAMFSTACELIQNKADLHWSLQYYTMTKQCFNGPRLPPPFIIISHLRLVIRSFWQRWKGAKIGGQLHEKEKRLESMKMEERCSYNYVLRKRNEKTDNSNARILALLKDIENSIKEGDDIEKDDLIFAS